MLPVILWRDRLRGWVWVLLGSRIKTLDASESILHFHYCHPDQVLFLWQAISRHWPYPHRQCHPQFKPSIWMLFLSCKLIFICSYMYISPTNSLWLTTFFWSHHSSLRLCLLPRPPSLSKHGVILSTTLISSVMALIHLALSLLWAFLYFWHFDVWFCCIFKFN